MPPNEAGATPWSPDTGLSRGLSRRREPLAAEWGKKVQRRRRSRGGWWALSGLLKPRVVRRGTQWGAVVIEGALVVVSIAGREASTACRWRAGSAAFLRALCRDHTNP